MAAVVQVGRVKLRWLGWLLWDRQVQTGHAHPLPGGSLGALLSVNPVLMLCRRVVVRTGGWLVGCRRLTFTENIILILRIPQQPII